MISIIHLFYIIASNLAILSLFFPVIADIIARKKNGKFSKDMKLFEIFIYLTLTMQLISISLAKLFSMSNLIIFRIYLPIHTAIFSYLLIMNSLVIYVAPDTKRIK